MGSRATTGAVLFVIAVGAIGAFAAYRAEERASKPAEPATAAAPETTDKAKTAEATPKSERAPAASTPSAPAGKSSADAASGSQTAPKPEAGDVSKEVAANPKDDAAQPAPSTADTTAKAADTGAPAAEPASDSAKTGSDAKTAAASEPATSADAKAAASSATDTAVRSDTDTKTVETFELETPTYDVVRVEPSGDAVIAGRASPGATIELRANGKVIATTTANASGEWVIVLDKPLPPGNYDIALHSSHPNAKAPATSSDRLAVSIPENGNETPLVALSRADGPVEVLQKPEETAVASASSAPSTGSSSAAPETKAAPAEGASTETKVASSAPTTDVTSTTATATSAGQEGKAPSASTAPESSASKSAAGETPAPSSADEGSDTVIANLVVREETMTVPREPSETSVTSEAPADTKSASAATPEQSTSGAGEASAAAAPAADASETTQTAAAKAPASADDVPDSELTGTGGDAEIAYAGDAEPKDALAAPKVPVTIESAEVSKDNQFVIQGTSEPGATIWLYLNQDFIGAVRAGGDGRWTFQTAMDMAPGQYSIRADQVRNMEGAVTARAQVPFGYRQDEAAPAETEMGSREEPAVDGPQFEVLDSNEDGVRVLVRRGDALWTIARNFYGDGFRYTTIYQANDSQIRDPNLIYPGQVFVLPGLTEAEVRAAQGG